MNAYARKRHFADCDATESPESHFFEQLNLDMEWATEAAKIFRERDGAEALESIAQGCSSLAGRRWSRFKQAQEEGEQKRAAEMEAFARFWYQLAAEIRQSLAETQPRREQPFEQYVRESELDQPDAF